MIQIYEVVADKDRNRHTNWSSFDLKVSQPKEAISVPFMFGCYLYIFSNVNVSISCESCRVYSALAHFIRSLDLKQDIVSFFEVCAYNVMCFLGLISFPPNLKQF